MRKEREEKRREEKRDIIKTDVSTFSRHSFTYRKLLVVQQDRLYKTRYSSSSYPSFTTEPLPLLSKTHTHSNG